MENPIENPFGKSQLPPQEAVQRAWVGLHKLEENIARQNSSYDTALETSNYLHSTTEVREIDEFRNGLSTIHRTLAQSLRGEKPDDRSFDPSSTTLTGDIKELTELRERNPEEYLRRYQSGLQQVEQVKKDIDEDVKAGKVYDPFYLRGIEQAYTYVTSPMQEEQDKPQRT
jgi:hypothetical protein